MDNAYQLYPILEVPGLYYYFNEKGNRVIVADTAVTGELEKRIQEVDDETE